MLCTMLYSMVYHLVYNIQHLIILTFCLNPATTGPLDSRAKPVVFPLRRQNLFVKNNLDVFRHVLKRKNPSHDRPSLSKKNSHLKNAEVEVGLELVADFSSNRLDNHDSPFSRYAT
jgi:hypothetical protein